MNVIYWLWALQQVLISLSLNLLIWKMRGIMHSLNKNSPRTYFLPIFVCQGYREKWQDLCSWVQKYYMSHSPRDSLTLAGSCWGLIDPYLLFTKWWVALTAPVLEMLVLAKTSLTTRANRSGSLFVALRTTYRVMPRGTVLFLSGVESWESVKMLMMTMVSPVLGIWMVL